MIEQLSAKLEGCESSSQIAGFVKELDSVTPSGSEKPRIAKLRSRALTMLDAAIEREAPEILADAQDCLGDALDRLIETSLVRDEAESQLCDIIKRLLVARRHVPDAPSTVTAKNLETIRQFVTGHESAWVESVCRRLK